MAKKERKRCILEVKMATERARRYLENLKNKQREKDKEVTRKGELGPTVQIRSDIVKTLESSRV